MFEFLSSYKKAQFLVLIDTKFNAVWNEYGYASFTFKTYHTISREGIHEFLAGLLIDHLSPERA
jgi:hypothetical protein